jgi:hypothetical protein
MICRCTVNVRSIFYFFITSTYNTAEAQTCTKESDIGVIHIKVIKYRKVTNKTPKGNANYTKKSVD